MYTAQSPAVHSICSILRVSWSSCHCGFTGNSQRAECCFCHTVQVPRHFSILRPKKTWRRSGGGSRRWVSLICHLIYLQCYVWTTEMNHAVRSGGSRVVDDTRMVYSCASICCKSIFGCTTRNWIPDILFKMWKKLKNKISGVSFNVTKLQLYTTV